jgi:hypothetical protein
MLQKYKEILYGVAFGVGAAIIDTAMDAHIQGHGVWVEIIQHPPMLFYRSMFVFFGLALGWLLWQKNKRERDFRHLTRTLERFHRECGTNVLLLHTKLQVLLTRNDLRLPHEAEELVQFAYQRSQALQTLLKEKLPPLSS